MSSFALSNSWVYRMIEFMLSQRYMDVIHFRLGATDHPFKGFDSSGASFLALGQTEGNTQISLRHLDSGATVTKPSLTYATALLVVHGRLALTTQFPETRIDFQGGIGAILEAAEA
jgi:hypothetical protein